MGVGLVATALLVSIFKTFGKYKYVQKKCSCEDKFSQNVFSQNNGHPDQVEDTMLTSNRID